MTYNDGLDCINIYSKGKTALGRALSNWAPIAITWQGITFASVEAWWYWYSTGKKHNHLINLVGYQAKVEGRKCKPGALWIGEELFYEIATLKLEQNPALMEMFLANNLPYVHYYEYGGNKVFPKKDITTPVWNRIREDQGRYTMFDEVD